MQLKSWKFSVIAVTCALFMAAWGGFGLTYGIDLEGGSVLIYELKGANVDEAQTVATVDILQRRLDSLGVKELTIRPAGKTQIMLQLPGISPGETERIKNVISQSGKLAFKIVAGPTGEIEAQANDPELQAAIQEVEQTKTRGEYNEKDFEYDTATFQRKVDRNVVAQFPVLLLNDDAVDGKYLDGAQRSPGLQLRPAVNFYVNNAGRSRLAHTTEKYQGKQMAIVLDGVIVSAPNIRTPITEGSGEIIGEFSKQEIDELITVLKCGALPARPVLQSEDSVAPTLGEEAVGRGMTAVKLAMLLTLGFMVLYYRAAGWIANAALAMNLIILMGVMALFEATLTLPGIAGIVLTMGMAVDANILINERIREEFKRGVPIGEAVREGYKNALSAILDSNITTILSAAILYYVGTGPIRGFAVTLLVGIATSCFTALWVTRALFDVAMARGWFVKPDYLTILSEPKIEFLKNRRPFVLAAIALVAVSLFIFAVRGPAKYGIDFNGGSAVQLALGPEHAMNEAEVTRRLAAIEVEQDGQKTHPYGEAEVQRLGAIDAKGRATSFQILLSSLGKEEEKSVAAEVTGQAETVAVEASEAVDRGPETPQARFVRYVAGAFEDVLVADAFSAPKWTDRQVRDGEQTKNVRRMSLDVRFAADRVDESISAPKIAELLAKTEPAKKWFAKSDEAQVALASENQSGVTTFTVTTSSVDFDTRPEAVETSVKSTIEKAYGRALSNPIPFKTTIGATVAKSLKARGLLAVILSLIMIVGYMAFRFELKMGVAAALCLFHDVTASLGMMMIFDLLGFDAKINLTTIAAFLTIVGYSINDTIVGFDRMRENLDKKGIDSSHKDYEDTLNASINQTLSRTILTSFTVFLVLVVLALAGVKALEGFTLAMLTGVIFGTLSTIYVATPLVLMENRNLYRLCAAGFGYLILMSLIGSCAAG